MTQSTPLTSEPIRAVLFDLDDTLLNDDGALDARTESLLRNLRDAGVPVGVVTNGPTELQWDKLRTNGIVELVDAAVVSQEFGANKPDPSIFRRALELIGAEPSTTIFVGDNAVADIGGAHGIGMRTAWIRHGREWDIAAYHPTHALDAVWEVRGVVGV